MKEIKAILEKIKQVSEQDFKAAYNKIKEPIEGYSDDDEYERLQQFDISTLIHCFDNFSDKTYETVSGLSISMNGTIKKLFPLAGYGWDGGNSIGTYTFNLTILSSSDIASGPIAEIVELSKNTTLGFALHVGQDFVVFQVFQ